MAAREPFLKNDKFQDTTDDKSVELPPVCFSWTKDVCLVNLGQHQPPEEGADSSPNPPDSITLKVTRGLVSQTGCTLTAFLPLSGDRKTIQDLVS